MESAVQIAALLTTIVAHTLGVRPPTPPPTKKDKLLKRSFFESYARKLRFITLIPITSLLSLQCLIILSDELDFGREITFKACPLPSIKGINAISSTELVGIGMMLIAAILRTWSIKTLDEFFTYEMTIRPNHKLVQSGPYGYVRHPGYTCTVLILIGSILVISFSPSTYLQTCGVKAVSSTARWVDRVWDLWVIYVAYTLLARAPIEDANLKATFGREWEEYRQRVPARFIPLLV